MATPGSALLSLRRTVTDAAGITAVLITVLLVCTLVTGIVAAVSSWQQRALRDSVQSLPATATTVEVRTSYDAESAAGLDAEMRRTLQPVLDPVGGQLLSSVETVDHRQPGGRAWAFAALSSSADAVVAETGRLPDVTAPSGTVEAAAPHGSGVAAGDRLTLVDPLEGRRVSVHVTGTWRPAPGAEQLVPPSASDALLVAEPALRGLAGRAATVTWRAAPALDRLTPGRLDDLAAAARPLDQSLAELGESSSASLQVDNPLPSTLRESAADLTAQRTLLLMPVAVLLLLGAAVALLVASALATNRMKDEGLLRSRGADRRRLVGPAALEAAVLCLVGGGAGLLLVLVGNRLLDRSGELGAPALAAAAIAAVVCWLALTAPALSRAVGGDRAMVEALERRRRRAATILVAVLVVVVALGAVALLGLRRLTDDSPSVDRVDLLVVAAPALLLLSTTTLLALVLLPAGFRLSTAGSSSRGLALALGTRAVSRSATRALPFALVVALVTGGLVHAAIERSSRVATVEAASADAVGADVRVLAPPSSVRAGPAREQARLSALPGVRDVTAVHRTSTFVDDVPVDVVVADLTDPAAAALLPPGSDDLLERLTAPGQGEAVPVAITDALAESAALGTGSTLELFVDRARSLDVVGTVPDVPTVADDRTAVVVHSAALGPGNSAPEEWWLSVTDDAADDVAATLAASPAVADEVLTRAGVREQLTVDPGSGGTAYDAALAATALGAGLLGVVLIASLVLLRRAERATTSAFLRALGASERDVTLTVALEQLVITGSGLLVGALAGALTAVLARTAGRGGELAVPWQTVTPALLTMLLLPLVVLLLSERSRHGSGSRRPAGRWSR